MDSAEMFSTDDNPEDIAMKIVVVLRHDLEPWQRLNVTAFTISGVASQKEAVGLTYQDGSGLTYLPMFKDPVLVFGADAAELGRTADRARSRNVEFSIFTEDLFGTFNDVDNRAAVAAVGTADLNIVGIAFRADRKSADKVAKGLRLLK